MKFPKFLQSIFDDLDQEENILYTLSRAIEAKDPLTLGHADRVAGYAMRLGRALGVSGRDLESLRVGGLLHDVGKIAVPDAILLKPSQLTVEEFLVMKRHPVVGCDICQKLKSIQTAIPLIRHHHERLDGSGYPDGLRNEQIPALARMITVVDIYDALRSARSYKEAFSVDKSFEILWQETEKGWWDKNLVAAWEKLVRANALD